jgi:hypothetical protein
MKPSTMTRATQAPRVAWKVLVAFWMRGSASVTTRLYGSV